MTPEEMRECRCLLDYLSDEDLVSLKYTVGGRTLAWKNRRETMNVIIRCSSSPEELLQRRKIRREILFQYLVSKSIIVASTTEKSVLIMKVLAFWKSQQSKHRSPKPSASNTRLAAPTSQRSTSGTATASNQPLQQTPGRSSFYKDTKIERNLKPIASHTSLATPTSQISASRSPTVSNQVTVSNTTCLETPTSQRPASETTSVYNQRSQQTGNRSLNEDQKVVSATTSNINRAMPPKLPSASTVPSQQPQEKLSNRGSQATTSNSTRAAPASWPTALITSTVSSHPLQVTLPNRGFQESWNEKTPTNQVFGESFVRWFYRLLNAENPAIPSVYEKDKFGPQHFWENCSMRIISKTSNRSDQTFTGNMLVSNRLKELAKDEHLLFHPNVSTEGVRTMKSSYGPFMLMVCGTIHHNNACLGIYHQVFGLVSNPLQDNNWKIQVTHLHVESLDDVSVIPRLSISADQDMLAVASAHAKSF